MQKIHKRKVSIHRRHAAAVPVIDYEVYELHGYDKTSFEHNYMFQSLDYDCSDNVPHKKWLDGYTKMVSKM